MRFIWQLWGTIWKTYFLFCLIVTLIILYPFYAILLTNEKYFKKGFKLIRFHALILLVLAGIAFTIEGKDKIKGVRNCIFIANHSSYLDILLFYRLSPEYFVFMAKRELSKVPLFNIFFKKANILIDRTSPRDAHRAFEAARRELQKGNSVVIFPEGGIPSSAPKMQRFKSGAFRLAIEEKKDIVPIIFTNNWKLLQDGSYFKSRSRPGKAKIIVNEPISTQNLDEDDLVSLQSECYKLIASRLKTENKV